LLSQTIPERVRTAMASDRVDELSDTGHDTRFAATVLSDELKRLATEAKEDALWTLKFSRKISRYDHVLKILSIVSAAAAGITILPDGVSRWVGAGLAFLSAVVGGASLAFKPDEGSRAFRARSVLWRRLGDDAHALRRQLGELPAGDAERRYQELLDRRDGIASYDPGEQIRHVKTAS
jgi:hypothetical protein